MSDRLLARTLRRAMLQGMREHPALSATPGGAPEVRLVGLDPIRVLIIGSGVAVGFGVRTHQDGLTGAVARDVQARTGRGVIVQNRAVPTTAPEQTVADLGMAGAASFGVVVWAPSLFDVVHSPERGRYHRSLVEGLRLLRETAPDGADIVLCALPISTARGPLEEIVRRLVPRFNASLQRVIAPFPGVRVAPTPSITTLADPHAFSADYYRRWAEQILRPEAGRQSRSA